MLWLSQVLISVQKNLLATEALWLSYLKEKYSFIRVYINEKEFAFSIDIKAPIFSNGLLKHQTSKNSSVCKKLIRKSMRFLVDYFIKTKPGKKNRNLWIQWCLHPWMHETNTQQRMKRMHAFSKRRSYRFVILHLFVSHDQRRPSDNCAWTTFSFTLR